MLILIKLIGIIIVVEGVIFLLSAKAMKKWISFWGQGKRILAGGLVSIIFGIIFLSAASQCKISMVITIIGVMSLIKGVVIFALGQEKMKARINWWAERPAGVVRLLALIAIAIGALLLYST